MHSTGTHADEDVHGAPHPCPVARAGAIAALAWDEAGELRFVDHPSGSPTVIPVCRPSFRAGSMVEQPGWRSRNWNDGRGTGVRVEGAGPWLRDVGAWKRRRPPIGARVPGQGHPRPLRACDAHNSCVVADVFRRGMAESCGFPRAGVVAVVAAEARNVRRALLCTFRGAPSGTKRS